VRETREVKEWIDWVSDSNVRLNLSGISLITGCKDWRDEEETWTSNALKLSEAFFNEAKVYWMTRLHITSCWELSSHSWEHYERERVETNWSPCWDWALRLMSVIINDETLKVKMTEDDS
jgi:hypothetical protein